MLWLEHNWLALFSLVIAVLAFRLSYKKYKHDTRPALVIREQAGCVFEIENLGEVPALGVELRLLERTSRPSARLHVSDLLRPRDTSILTASNYPLELIGEIEQNAYYWPVSYNGVKLDNASPLNKIIAYYLLTRDEKHMVILRFKVADETKTFVRLFGGSSKSCCRGLWNRFGASVLEWRYGKNAILREPDDWLSALKDEGPEPESDEYTTG